jgi:hypothetical protein
MSRTPAPAEQIERELEALGEDPPTAEELAMLERDVDDDPDIATVARLTELARAEAPASLSELELQAAWRKAEQRLDHSEPAPPRRAGSSPRRWLLLAATGLAAAAAVLVIVVPQTSESEPSAAEIAELGDQVRASLAVIDDGESGTQRADALVAAYQQQLALQQESGG